MKKYFLLITSVFIFTFHFIASAQHSHFGEEENMVFIEPDPAQGNSIGIEYNLVGREFIEDPTKEYTISYNSAIDKVMVVENESRVQEIFPQSTGTEIVDKKEIYYNYENPDILLSDYYYSMVLESRIYGMAYYINYDWVNFQERLTTLGNLGYRIENIDIYGASATKYAGTWTKDGQGWAYATNYVILNTFILLMNSWTTSTARYRPINFAMHSSGTWQSYSAVGIEDNLAYAWIFNESNTTNFLTWINTQYGDNRRLVDLELYRNPSGNMMYAGISEFGQYAQQVVWDVDWPTFQSKLTQMQTAGYRLIDFDKYDNGGIIKYAGLWNSDGIGAAWLLNSHNQNDFSTAINNYANLGYKPIMVDIYDYDWLDIEDEKDDYQLVNFLLRQNYPNPFNPTTIIEYNLPKSSDVKIEVYNITGQKIGIPLNKKMVAGNHQLEFNAQNLSSGIYYYRIEAGEFQDVKKMILLR